MGATKGMIHDLAEIMMVRKLSANKSAEVSAKSVLCICAGLMFRGKVQHAAAPAFLQMHDIIPETHEQLQTLKPAVQQEVSRKERDSNTAHPSLLAPLVLAYVQSEGAAM